MADPAAKKRQATYQDVLDAPDHAVAEIINGELRLTPRPAGPHAGATSMLGYLLGPPFHLGNGGPGGWIILFEPELHLGTQIVVPDIAGWRRERLASISEDAFFTLAPDWLCETLSPSTRKMDRAEKLPIYAAAGVQYLWLLDPRDRTLEVLRLHEGSWLQLGVHKDDDKIRAEPFAAIEIDLAVIWADLPPPPTKGTRAAEGQSVYDY